jgi:uncharacterized protein (TIGR02996 family)
MTEEDAFLQALQERPDDDTTRLIFADWLEEQGDEISLAKAAYIRFDCELARKTPEEPALRRLQARRRELAERVAADWLAVVTKAVIEKCTFRYECPLKWENLEPVDGSTTERYCHQCETRVVFFGNIVEARNHALRGGCVALDPALVRSKDDLDTKLEEVVTGMLM